MALQDTDFFLVNRDSQSYKMAATALAAYVGDGGASVHVGENPPDGDSNQGDLWWKSDVGILYVYYIDENTEQWVQAAGSAGGGGSDGGSSSVTVSAAPPTNPAPTQGDLWWNTTDGRLYVFYTDDNSTQWVDASPAPSTSGFLELTGGNLTGGVTATVRTIVAGATGFNLQAGNLWECGAIAVPNPTNEVAGMTGVIVFTAAPTAFGSNFKFPNDEILDIQAFPAVVPFYVKGPSEILLGNAVEGII